MDWLPDLVFLDIETNGGSAKYDRITEIALIKIENGQKTVEWQTLINPEEHIPSQITNLTGITNKMVQYAPTFKEIAAELYSYLEGCVLVAHNCRFDYGFLKAEYARLDATLKLRTLCTVKLSRRLYPSATSHSLDSIIHRFGLQTDARHRAMGDTQLMIDFLEAARDDLGSVKVLDAIHYLLKGPTLPTWLDDTFLKTIKDVPGVYIFYDEKNVPLYVGKSIKLKSRVLNHFSSDHKSNTEMEISQKVRRVEWRETAGELGALLLEAKLVKQLYPAYNRLLRNVTKVYSICLSEQLNDLPWIKIVTTDEVDPENISLLYGTFKTKKKATDTLRKLADELKLCHRVLGLERGKGTCFAHQIGKCSGVCCGKESYELHHLKLQQALMQYKIKHWPYQGRIAIKESNANATEVHLFEDWCHLDTVNNQVDLEEALTAKYEKRFDLDFYRLIKKSINDGFEVIQLRVA